MAKSKINRRAHAGGRRLLTQSFADEQNLRMFTADSGIQRIHTVDDLPDPDENGDRLLPGGHYLITDNINIGATRLVINTASTVTLASTTPYLVIGGSHPGGVIYTKDVAANVRISDLGIVALAGGGHCLHMSAGGDLSVSSAQFNAKLTTAGDAVRIDGSFCILSATASNFHGAAAGTRVLAGAQTWHTTNCYWQSVGAGTRPFVIDGGTVTRMSHMNPWIRAVSGAEYNILIASGTTMTRPARFTNAFLSDGATGTVDPGGIIEGANLILTDDEV